MTNLDRLAEIFPEVITETRDSDGNLIRAVDFERLKQILSGELLEGREAYVFNFVGKKRAEREAHSPTDKTLRPVIEQSRDFNATQNLYIEGDNLDALKILLESYLGKVKMIYIDPPYNTGNDFIYRDDFTQEEEEFDSAAKNLDASGNRLFANRESNGRFHSDWCAMIYARLLLAKNFLADDGVIFISIDDHEQANLKKICDEVFGERNFVAQLIWKKKYTGGKGTKTFADYHEYILCYAKSIYELGEVKMARPENEKTKFTQEDEYLDERGRYYTRPLKSNLDPRPTLVYSITLPNGDSVTTQWICARNTYEQLLREGRIEFKDPATSKYPVYKKFYENDDGGNVKIPSFLEVSSNNEAKEELKRIFNIKQTRDLPFQTPKPLKLIELFIKTFATAADSIVLDFFSGSATAAHAVMELNAQDGGHRRFIMIQLPEETPPNSEARRAGYKNICEIGKERIRRAGDKLKETAPDLDTGFRVFKVDSSNYLPLPSDARQLLLMAENLKVERTAEDLFFGTLLRCGLPIDLKFGAEILDGFKILSGNGGEILACFEKNLTAEIFRELAHRQPRVIIFRDHCFKDSAAKINATEYFKIFAPETEVIVL